MTRARRAAAAAGISVLLLFGTTACALLPLLSHGPSQPTAEATEEAAGDPAAQNAEALGDWTETQRAAIPDAQAAHPGVFSDVSVETSIEESTGDDVIPDGSTVSVVRWSYVYATAMDWTTTGSSLEHHFAAIDDDCQSVLFTDMREAGVTGPISVNYYYTDINSGSEPEWTYTCSGN